MRARYSTSICLFAAICILLSCSSGTGKTDVSVLRIVNQGLASASLAVFVHTESVYHTLESKLNDPVTHYKAAVWYPRAIIIQNLSHEMFDYIQKLRNDLLERTGFSAEHLAFDELDKRAVNALFLKESQGVLLFQKLRLYKDSILGIDPLIKQQFMTLALTPKSLNMEKTNNDSINVLFSDLSALGALTLLAQAQNSVRIFENKTVNFCNDNTNTSIDWYTRFEPIVSQNSTYLRNGEFLKVKAGIVSLVAGVTPKVTINNNPVQINDYGYAEYQLKLSQQPGRYLLPIKIQYVDQDGNKKTFERKIDYFVAN